MFFIVSLTWNVSTQVSISYKTSSFSSSKGDKVESSWEKFECH